MKYLLTFSLIIVLFSHTLAQKRSPNIGKISRKVLKARFQTVAKKSDSGNIGIQQVY
ncbi:MAG: hypothetical protein HC831_24880 [Chloroflexia bacterium]|nr:hypothetical protein [Chloroflexia bacterium]